jgi:hypothetical protein
LSFPHEHRDFDGLLRIVAGKRKLSTALVEKDYWVTHSLWALHQLRLEIWFKGGTSLSKGFGLIERFSEDLDLKIEPGMAKALPAVGSWKSEGKKAVGERQAFFAALAKVLRVPSATVSVDPGFEDRSHRSAQLRIVYPGTHRGTMAATMKPFVLLEVGSARVTPFVERDMTSFVHEELAALGQLGDFDANRPRVVRCVHPLVTLLEKLDALHRRVPRADVAPATFVRHFEDAAGIIAGEKELPPLAGYEGPRALAAEMLAQRQLATLPSAADQAFRPDASGRFMEIRRAHAAIAPIFWGQRVELEEACARIRRWIAKRLSDA